VSKPNRATASPSPSAAGRARRGARDALLYRRHVPREYSDSAIVARRGSWNRTKLNGYDVVRVTVSADGRNAKVEPFVTGFMDAGKNTFWGRPVDVMQMPDGALLVADEQVGRSTA
jgi:glucose/arabinose dehydrogenase